MGTGAMQAGAGDGRRCDSCGSLLAADNNAHLCGACTRDLRDQLRTPPAQLRDDFFDTDEFHAAFESEDIGKIFKAYRNHPYHLKRYGKPINQELLARWLGISQGLVSKLESGMKKEEYIPTLRQYAKKLHFPQRLLWFKLDPRQELIIVSRSDAESRPAPANSAVPDSLSSTPDDELISVTGMDTVELIQRMRSSSINSATVDALNITVDQLCCDYAHADARRLIATSKEWLNRATNLLNNRLTLPQHRDILHNAGMLALLVGCLEYDLGQSAPAEATRRMASKLGEESGVPGIVGWSHEMLAWFHLTAGNPRAVVPVAEAGIISSPSHSVAVQLYGQQAKAYARMGMREQVHEALERGSALLDKLPYPERPDNHFVVDPDKWDFYAMDTYRIVGEDALAERNAREVIRRSTNADGFVSSPMRKTEAELTLAVIAARRGDIDEASTLGIAALGDGRRSRPSLLMVASELDHEIRKGAGGARTDFSDLLADLKQAPDAQA
ncbi:helix-turn-helix domain-containing protein [Actinophytocola glycyrrhizae]|uniref:Helix-turn-helix domain-containing protein n=1 Tax=Actinophytocola glycyrrhizae TaxID=2044873 RepID=A0ABV9S0V7_9PSEU